MRILVAHNSYQIPGGEDAVVAQEVALLRARGVAVELLSQSNDSVVTLGQRIRTAVEAPYSWPMRRAAEAAIARFAPDVLHVHNTFPRLTPSIYDAAADARCPVVQTIHNFRLLCLGGTLFRDGEVCLDCAGKSVAWSGIRHACYRGSRAGSATVAVMNSLNHWRGAWSRRVDRFLMLTPFARDLFAAHTNIDPARMLVKPNAAPDPGLGTGEGGYALFAGRLSPEKGIAVLLQAAEQGCAMPVLIAGQGPLEPEVRQAHARGVVHYLGPLSPPALRAHMRAAAVLLLPSLWYEGLPMVLAEAFGAGLPVLGSRLGALASLIDEERTGLLFEPGSADNLARACHRIVADPELLRRMRAGARLSYEANYTPERNGDRLLAIYSSLRGAGSRPAESPVPVRAM